jgi:hypothetical protein
MKSRMTGKVWVTVAPAVLAVLLLGGCCASPCAPCAEPAVAAERPPADLPPGAKPDEVWCRVWVPPLTREVVENCQVCPATVKKVPIPATYGTRTELVCVQPAQIIEKKTPAVWTTRTRDVLVCPERECVEVVCCPSGSNDPCCDPGCKCYAKKVIPAVWRKECEAVCLEPSKCCIEFVPAQYKCVETTYVLKPAHCEEVCVPAKWESRRRTAICRPGRWEWRLNPDCVPPEEPLSAIEVTMVDNAPSGASAGIFKVGDKIRLDVTVSNDVGGRALQGLKVVFTLPPELEYDGGGGDVVMVGGVQQAESKPFDLALDQTIALHVIATVKRAPSGDSRMIQTEASVVTREGVEMVRESESSTIEGVGQ